MILYSVKSIISKVAKFSDVELVMPTIVLDEEEEAEHKLKKRKWVHEAWKKIENEGGFATLYKDTHWRKAITSRERLAVCLR